MNVFISKLGDIFADPRATVRLLWTATAVIIIITFFAAYLKVRTAPQTLALHYNVIVGVDLLGNRKQLYTVPLTAVAIAAVNVLFLRLSRLRQPFLSVLLAAASCACAIILLAATLFLYNVN